MRKKSCIFALSILFLLIAVVGCGKKGDPIPRSLPIPGEIGDLRGEMKDGVLFLSFTVPSKTRDDSDIQNIEGFKFMKSCSTCLEALEPFKDIRIDEEKGYTIRQGRLYIYDDDLTPGYEYAYRVYPYTKNETRGNGSNIYTLKWVEPPEKPRGVHAKAGDATVELNWAQEPGAFYNIYRYNDGIYPIVPLNEKPLSAGIFFETGLENGKKYHYEVRKVENRNGVNYEGEGTRIEVTPVDKIPPPAPFDVKAVRSGKGVAITWDQDAVEDILGYNVFRVTGGKTEKLNVDIIREETYFDASPRKARYVSYYVTSLDMSSNESEPSQESVVTLRND